MTTEVNQSMSAHAPEDSPPEDVISQTELFSETLSNSAVECQDEEDWEDNPEPPPGSDRDLWLYRDRTTALLWRYARLAVELGRLPSLLGREFFRARISRYAAQTFEDCVIFVHDVECCLQALEPADNIVIAMLGVEQYTQEETAFSLHCTQRTIARHFGEALDRLSEIFLKREILAVLPATSCIRSNACQEAKTGDLLVSDSA
jgi:hypothetical protein